MKKVKLITSLSSLAMVGTTLSIAATGCSASSPDTKETLSLNIGALPTLVAPHTNVGEFEIRGFTDKGPATISNIDIISNSNPDAINVSITNEKKLKILSLNEGTSDVEIKATDTNNNVGKLKLTFTVSNTSISIDASSIPTSIGINYNNNFQLSAEKQDGTPVALSASNITITNKNENVVKASWTEDNKLKIQSFTIKGAATVKIDVNEGEFEGSVTLHINVEYQNVQLILNTSSIPNQMNQNVTNAKYTITATRLNETSTAFETAKIAYVLPYATGTGIKNITGGVEGNNGFVNISTTVESGIAELTILIIDDKDNAGIATLTINVKTTTLAKNYAITTIGECINLPDNLDPNCLAQKNGDGNYAIGDSGIILIPSTIKSLTITSCDPNKTVIETSHELPLTGPGFLEECTELTSLDISGLSYVTNLGDNFLRKCNKLTSVDLTSLTSVNTIGHFFLNACSKLQSINLSFMSKVTNIDSYFMAACTSITHIDLSPLANVITIGNGFLTSFDKVKSIDLSPLKNVTTIGTGFLAGYDSLTEIDLSKMSSLTTIGAYFLESCTNLQTIKLPIPKSGTIPTLLEDHSLGASYTWGSDVAASTKDTRVLNIDCGSTKYYNAYIGNANWNKITSDLQLKTENTKIVNWVQSTENKIVYHDNVANNEKASTFEENISLANLCNSSGSSSGTIQINPSGTEPITIQAKNVKAIVLKSINDSSIPDNFLAYCNTMEDLIFDKIKTTVVGIGDNFLSNCKALMHLDVSQVKGVTTIGSTLNAAKFLESCTALETLTLWSSMPTSFNGWSTTPLTNLTTIHCGSIDAAETYIANTSWNNTTAIPNAQFVV